MKTLNKLLLILFISSSFEVLAVDFDINESMPMEDILNKGILLDRTITNKGHQFFKAFRSKWHLPKGILSHIITVYEKPTSNGSMIWIIWNYKKVYEGKISFRESDDKKPAYAALKVSNIMEQSKGMDFAYSEDLAPDEFL